MSYVGKFIDRFPETRAAGLQLKHGIGMKEAMAQDIYMEEKVTALKNEFCIKEHPYKNFPVPPDSGKRYEGVCNEMRHVVNPEPKTYYENVDGELKESCYLSHWTQQLATSRDPVGNVPYGFDPLRPKTPRKTNDKCTARELVNPDKLAGQVLFESSIGERLYKLSHNNYAPGEKINRNYLPESFDPNKRYGMRKAANPEGECMPKCLEWYNNQPHTIGSSHIIDAEFPRTGKPQRPQHILGGVVPLNFKFGQTTLPDFYGAKELLAGGNLVVESRDEINATGHINAVRHGLHKVQSFEWQDFLARLRNVDKDEICGWIPLSDIYKISQEFRINFQKPKLELMLKRLGILDHNQRVKYLDFWKLLNTKYEIPDFQTKINGIPPEHLYYETSYQSFCKSDLPDTSGIRPAGVSTDRNDLIYPQGPDIMFKENLSDETDVHSRLYPSLISQHGTSYRTYFKPRSLEILKKMCLDMGLTFTDKQLHALYMKGLEYDKTGGVCIDTFLTMLDQLGALKLRRGEKCQAS